MICSVEGCDRQSDSRGWCKSHYMRWWKGNPDTVSLIRTKATHPCRVEGCDRATLAWGWCKRHYERWRRRGGDPSIMAKRGPKQTPFWENVAVGDPNDCWEWEASSGYNGYGQYRHNGKMTGAHRVAWNLTHGTIPDGLQVLHHCDNPSCVNPAHLWLGTQRDNIHDMIRKGRHPFAEQMRGAA